MSGLATRVIIFPGTVAARHILLMPTLFIRTLLIDRGETTVELADWQAPSNVRKIKNIATNLLCSLAQYCPLPRRVTYHALPPLADLSLKDLF